VESSCECGIVLSGSIKYRETIESKQLGISRVVPNSMESVSQSVIFGKFPSSGSMFFLVRIKSFYCPVTKGRRSKCCVELVHLFESSVNFRHIEQRSAFLE
jgi:hypothetical protein